MSSKRSRAASRANGKKSHGPVTPEGKARSAANAPIRHGLASRERAVHGICLSNENPAEFMLLYDALAQEHAPVTTTEHLTVHEMAVCRWRLHRAWAMESALLNNQMDHDRGGLAKTYESFGESTRASLAFRNLTEASPSLPTLLRYEIRLSRQFKSCLKSLTDLRVARQKHTPPAEPNPINEHLTNDTQLQHSQPAATPEPPPRATTGLTIAPSQATPQVDVICSVMRTHASDDQSGSPCPLPRAA